MSDIQLIWGHDLRPYVSGETEPWSVSVLQALVRLRRPQNLLELGTYTGSTTRALASVMPSTSRLWTVDHEKRHEGFEDPHIIFVQKDAEEFLRGALVPFHFVFVDDDHGKEHVARELDLLLEGSLMAEGGIIVGHDVIGVFDLAPLFEARGGFVGELPLLHAGGSLGVIEVPRR